MPARKRSVIGIDVGGTKTLCILVDEESEVIGSLRFQTAPKEGSRRFTERLLIATRKLESLGRKQGFEIVGIGVGCAGQIDAKELKIIHSPNLLALNEYPMGKHLKRVHPVRIWMANDVQMGIYGEHRLGAAKGCAHLLGVFFGTGVGGAAIIGGDIHTGASGFGGNVGVLLAQPVGGPEAALSHGIVDRIASKAAIASEALVMAVKNWAPWLHKRVGTDLSKISWGMLKDAIENGDDQIEQMLRARMKVVGIALADVINFLNPEMLVLGGGLVEAMPKLVLSEIEGGLRQYLVPEVSKILKVREAKLGGEAVALGAAHFALKQLHAG
jgi:glucokinase